MNLGIDTSGTSLGLAAVADGSVIAERLTYPGLKHGEIIQNEIGRFLRDNEISFADLKGIATTIGPGSFTGVRIGLAAAKAYAYALKIPLAGLSTLHAIAGCVRANNIKLVSLLDARRNEIYWAVFERNNGQVARLSPDSIGKIDDLAELMEIDPILYGPAHLQARFERQYGAIIYRPNDEFNLAVPAALIGEDDIKHGRYFDLGSCTPIYLRPPGSDR